MVAASAIALAGLTGAALPASAVPQSTEPARQGTPAPREDAPTYAKPTPPTQVTATAVSGGVRVSWAPVAANPPITRYSIHAGPGSCPVVVPAGATSAVLPVVAGVAPVVSVVIVSLYPGWLLALAARAVALGKRERADAQRGGGNGVDKKISG